MSERASGADSIGRVMRTFGKLALLPLSTFAAGTDALARVARGVQEAAGQSLDTMSGGFDDALASERSVAGGESLADDQVKLVDYAVVSASCGREQVLEHRQIVVIDHLSDEAFSAWRIADYLEGAGRGLSEEERQSLRVSFKVLDRWPPEEGS